MASTDIRPPSHYLAHWHACLEWLAVQGSDAEILLGSYDSSEQVSTAANKARSMRRSVVEYPGWPFNVKSMVADGKLSFAVRRASPGSWHLYALVSQSKGRRTQILQKALNDNK